MVFPLTSGKLKANSSKLGTPDLITNVKSEIGISPELKKKTNKIWILKALKVIKIYSYPLVQYFGMLFWDDITIFWDENYVNKLLICPKQVFFSVKNHNKFSSQNNIPKYCIKGHEQVFFTNLFPF